MSERENGAEPDQRALSIPARLERLAEVRDFVDRAAEEAGFDEAARYEIKLAVNEAVTNAIRHSGATRIEVHLRRTAHDGLRLRVRDDGVGLRESGGPGGGLRGMRERALTVGGRLSVHSAPGEGVEVRLDIDGTGASS
jgi:two-component system sensor histidine kinase UhpB